jgi:nucleotide-binding universal stress UspA family protein
MCAGEDHGGVAEDVGDDEVRRTARADEAGPVGTAGSVVAALDGSQADEPVVDRAADEAAWLGAPLRLVSAVDPGVQLTPYEALATGSPSLADLMEEGAQQILARAAARARERHPGLEVATSTPWGTPSAAVVRLSQDALRVVVGAPRGGALERVLLGSVSLPVVAHAHCPVVVVPAGTAVVPPRRIVVGVDGSDHSAGAVRVALATAQATGGTVTAVLGWNLEVHEGTVVAEPGSERWRAVEQRCAARAHAVVDPLAARYPDVPVEVRVRHGAPARAVLDEAAEQQADLVVVGSRGRGGFTGLLLGSVSRRVVQHAGCVVVVAR